METRDRKKLKIGYVIKYFHPIKGGAENNILNIASMARKDGHDVHVFTSDRKGKEKLSKLEDVYKSIKIHRSRTWFDFSLYLGFYPGLLFKLLKADLDIVHVSGFGFIWNDFVLILKKIFSRKTKFINTPHGPFMALSDYNFILKAIRSTYTLVQKIFLNWLYDKVIQVNTFQWQWIVEYGISKDKVVFVPNGISKDLLDLKINGSQIESFRKKYNLEDSKIISYLGRISKYKGVQHIIEVLPKLVEKNKKIKLLVMGRDEGYVSDLEALAERKELNKKVCFITDISEEEKFVGLEASEIFVFPSEWEAFGIVLAEAMTRSNAVVSTKTEGGNFLVTDNVNGYLYDFGDTEKLLSILSNMISNPEKVEEMQKLNKEMIQSYTWEEIYEKYYKILLGSGK